jgi:hypothetical protein
VYCYCVHPRVSTWQPELKLDHDVCLDTEMNNFRKLAHEQPFGPNGRARLGFAMDTMFVQSKVLKDAFNEAREHGVHLITSHITRVSMMDSEFIPASIFRSAASLLVVHTTNLLLLKTCHPLWQY